MATIQNKIFLKIYEENSVFTIIQKLQQISSPSVWDIYLGIISVNFAEILPQKSWVIEIFLLLRIFIISEIINTKTCSEVYSS